LQALCSSEEKELFSVDTLVCGLCQDSTDVHTLSAALPLLQEIVYVASFVFRDFLSLKVEFSVGGLWFWAASKNNKCTQNMLYSFSLAYMNRMSLKTVSSQPTDAKKALAVCCWTVWFSSLFNSKGVRMKNCCFMIYLN
jgi:hypothetical protein